MEGRDRGGAFLCQQVRQGNLTIKKLRKIVMRPIYRESLLKVLGLANLVELDTMGAEAVAMERSLRLLHRWGVLHENPEETWRRVS